MAHSPEPASTAAHPKTEGSAHTVDAHTIAEIQHHLFGYWIVFGGLLIGTLLTVYLSYQDLGSWNIPVALLVATLKASAVAAFFMHLKGERATIWRFLFFTAIFATGMFALTYLHYWDPIMGTSRNHH